MNGKYGTHYDKEYVNCEENLSCVSTVFENHDKKAYRCEHFKGNSNWFNLK